MTKGSTLQFANVKESSDVTAFRRLENRCALSLPVSRYAGTSGASCRRRCPVDCLLSARAAPQYLFDNFTIIIYHSWSPMWRVGGVVRVQLMLSPASMSPWWCH